MNATTTVPVTIEPKAGERVTELGMQAEFDKMLDYARAHIPQLTRIVVEWADPHDTGSEPGVHIMAYSRCPYESEEPPRERLIAWLIGTFPPTVLQYFTFSYMPGDGDEG
jgi:hypothetical protein